MEINIRRIGIGVGFLVFLFLMCAEMLTGSVLLGKLYKHIDEIAVLICILYIALNFHMIIAQKFKLVYLWFVFLLIGAISTLIFDYQSLVYALIDAIVISSKFIFGYCAVYIYAQKTTKNISNSFEMLARLIALIFFVLTVHDMIFTPIFEKSDFRYFTESIKLMFPHTTYLTAASVSLLVFLGYKNTGYKNLMYMFMITFVGCMTLRSKAIGFFAVYWALYILFVVLKNRNYILMLIGGGAGAVVLVWDSIARNFFSALYSPRDILMRDGIQMAIEHFPFGTGFGTFGSSVAAENYSPLYVELGYEDYYGMSSTDTQFLTDGFWPTIIAQYGFIGAIVFVLVILLFLFWSINKMKKEVNAGFAMLMILVYCLVASLAETSFFNPTSLLMFMLFAIFETEK